MSEVYTRSRSALFPGLLAAVAVAADPRLTRSFAGDGTPYLHIPGNKRVTSVSVGGAELPPTVRQSFPADLNNTTQVAAEWPLWMRTDGEDGVPLLVRSVQSNDGVWQDGVTVVVTGEWEPEPEPPKPEPPKPESGGEGDKK